MSFRPQTPKPPKDAVPIALLTLRVERLEDHEVAVVLGLEQAKGRLDAIDLKHAHQDGQVAGAKAVLVTAARVAPVLWKVWALLATLAAAVIGALLALK